MSRRCVLLVALCFAACGGNSADIGSSASHYSVVKEYNREVQFLQPRASCDIYLEQRATDEGARSVYYSAEVDGRAVSILYSIIATDPLPLKVSLYDAAGRNTFSVAAAAHSLAVLDRTGETLRGVDAYDGDASTTTVSGSGTIDDADGLALLGCALANRTTLGDVAAFLRNLSSGGLVPGSPDVGSSSENAAPILPNWDGNVSLLGAYWLMSGCLDQHGWKCGCWQSTDVPGVVGAVPGSCP